ncbi:MAG: (S)-acetoin forming diacetyl reductase [Gammaproteobacteria bacterium]|nr:MAG: (S)-acetoin forming diacetyl reductase [Gammaproteobacteria bacterium]
MKLESRKAIITGAAQGMGGTITQSLAREGADIVLTARTREPLEEMAEKVRALGRQAIVVSADVTDESQVENVIDKAKEAFDGRIDILVNAAGATGPIETPVWEIEVSAFNDLLHNNITGAFLPIKHVLPTMIAQRYGKIVTIGGASGVRGYRHRAGYSSSKWAIRGLTRSTALDAGEYNVNVNAIMPGIVETPRMEKLCREKAKKRGWTYEQVYQEYVDEMALKRVTTPQDIADAVIFLASDDSRNITGQEIVVCGGWAV